MLEVTDLLRAERRLGIVRCVNCKKTKDRDEAWIVVEAPSSIRHDIDADELLMCSWQCVKFHAEFEMAMQQQVPR